MATFKCLECTHLVSSEAKTCPKCGADVAAMIKKVMGRPRPKKSAMKKESAPWINQIKHRLAPYITKRNQKAIVLFVIALAAIGLLRLLLVDTHSDMFADTPGVGYVDTTGMDHPTPKSAPPKQRSDWWDGSHVYLTRLIKARLNDPKSYQHINTATNEKDGKVFIMVAFRAKNGYGALVKQLVVAEASKAGTGRDVEILSWN